MNKKVLLTSALFLSFLTPTISYAALCTTVSTARHLTDVICIFIDLISITIPIVAGLALLTFFWGLAKFILHADNEDGRAEGKQVMKWGIVALFVMVSIWGIVSYLQFDLFGVSTPNVPQLPTDN